MNRKTFEEKIKPILTYIGTIGAILAGVMYMIVVFVLIFGFEAKSITQSIIFASVNAVIGLIIMFFLKVQGVSFAKELPENQEILKEYNKEKPKKKSHSINYFWVSSTLKDVILKGLSVGLATMGIVYIVIEGSQDYNLLLLALANLILFACFGLLSLSSAYDFYNENHIPYIQEQIQLRKEKQNDIQRQQQQLNLSVELTTTSSEE